MGNRHNYENNSSVVAIVIVVGIFIGIIATADYGDFVKERELRNLELSYYETTAENTSNVRNYLDILKKHVTLN